MTTPSIIKTTKGYWYVSTYRKVGRHAEWVGPFPTEEIAINVFKKDLSEHAS